MVVKTDLGFQGMVYQLVQPKIKFLQMVGPVFPPQGNIHDLYRLFGLETLLSPAKLLSSYEKAFIQHLPT